SRQKVHLQPPRPPSHLARLQSPLPRIPLQSGRLLGWHPSARPSDPTPCCQRPHRQGPQLLQPCRADSARRPAPSQLQHQRHPPRRPRPAESPNAHRQPSPDTSPVYANSASLNVSPALIATTSPALAAPPSPLAAASLNTPSFLLSPDKSAHKFQTLSS